MPKPTLPDAPFVIGTTKSAEAVLEVKALVDKLVYRDLRTAPEATDDDNIAEKPCEFTGTSCEVVDTEGSEVDTGTDGSVSVSQDDGSDGE